MICLKVLILLLHIESKSKLRVTQIKRHHGRMLKKLVKMKQSNSLCLIKPHFSFYVTRAVHGSLYALAHQVQCEIWHHHIFAWKWHVNTHKTTCIISLRICFSQPSQWQWSLSGHSIVVFEPWEGQAITHPGNILSNSKIFPRHVWSSWTDKPVR